MKAGHQFLLGAALIVGSVGFLIAEGVKNRGLFPDAGRAGGQDAADPTFVEDVGFKVGAKVVPGSVRRNAASRTIDFRVSDGVKPTRSPTPGSFPTPSPTPTTSR